MKVVAALALAMVATCLAAQEPELGDQINEIPFESLPGDSLVQGAGGIQLQSHVTVSGNLTAVGIVESAAGGVRYPDGTLQTTAAGTPEGYSANAGMYSNRIADFIPSQPFSEICFKNGQIFGDIHATSESTAGGACVPGDLGWVIERNQRTAVFWEEARVVCLLIGMRLPEPFEFQYSCREAGDYGLNSMTGDWEWASNGAAPIQISSTHGLGVVRAGLSSCNSAGAGWVGTSTQVSDTGAFRCLR